MSLVAEDPIIRKGPGDAPAVVEESHIYPDIAAFQSAIDAEEVVPYEAGYIESIGDWYFNRNGVPTRIREVVWSSGTQCSSAIEAFGTGAYITHYRLDDPEVDALDLPQVPSLI